MLTARRILLTALLAALLFPAPSAAQQREFRIARPLPTLRVGAVDTVKFDATADNGRRVASPAGRCLSYTPTIVQVEWNVVMRALAPGRGVLACAWMPGSDGLLIDTASVVVVAAEQPAPPGPGTREPDLEETFAYTSTAQLLASPLYARSEDINSGRIALDTSVRYDGHPTMRYDYPARGPDGRDYTISRTIDLRGQVVTEVWVEAVVRFDPHFTLDGGADHIGKALKLLHVGVYGPAGRFGLNFENGDGGQLNAEGPNDAYEALYLRGSVKPRALFDGQWHVLRYHVRLGSPALHEFWVDGVYHGQRTGSTSATRLWAIALARNLNQGPPREQSLWWGRVRVWFADPGWTPEG